MKLITAAQSFVRVHLAAWWPKSSGEELARQYKAFAATCPLVVADMARRALAFDNTFDEKNGAKSDYNQGRRSFWLETQALIGIAPDDLQSLREMQRRTEHDSDED